MKEKDFQSLFTKYLKSNNRGTAAYELKICKGNALPFNAVKEHQEFALSQVKHGYLVHKISDLGAVMALPFDCFCVAGAPAYVVIMYYKPRTKKSCFMIDIDTWITERINSKRKSLTKERAAEIGEEIIF